METYDPGRLYSLVADESVVAPRSFVDTALLHEATVSILRKYMDSFYRTRQGHWDTETMVYKEGDEEDSNFQDFTVRVARGEAELITATGNLIDEADGIYRKETQELRSIHFDRHLYQPLLVERDDKVRSEPPGLNDGERRLMEDLRARYDDGSWDRRRFAERHITRGMRKMGCLLMRKTLRRGLEFGSGIKRMLK